MRTAGTAIQAWTDFGHGRLSKEEGARRGGGQGRYSRLRNGLWKGGRKVFFNDGWRRENTGRIPVKPGPGGQQVCLNAMD